MNQGKANKQSLCEWEAEGRRPGWVGCEQRHDSKRFGEDAAQGAADRGHAPTHQNQKGCQNLLGAKYLTKTMPLV